MAGRELVERVAEGRTFTIALQLAKRVQGRSPWRQAADCRQCNDAVHGGGSPCGQIWYMPTLRASRQRQHY